jgi:hypothetical protein
MLQHGEFLVKSWGAAGSRICLTCPRDVHHCLGVYNVVAWS